MRSPFVSLLLSATLWVNSSWKSVEGQAQFPIIRPLLHSTASRIATKLHLQHYNNNKNDEQGKNDADRKLQFSGNDFEQSLCPTFQSFLRQGLSSIPHLREAGRALRCACDASDFSIICAYRNICTTVFPSCNGLNYCSSEFLISNLLTGNTRGVSRVNQNTSDPSVAYTGAFLEATVGVTTSFPAECEARLILAEDGLEYTCNSCEICGASGAVNLNCSNIQPEAVTRCEDGAFNFDTGGIAFDGNQNSRTCFPPDQNATVPRPTTAGAQPMETNELFDTLQQRFTTLRTGATATSGGSSPTLWTMHSLFGLVLVWWVQH